MQPQYYDENTDNNEHSNVAVETVEVIPAKPKNDTEIQGLLL